MDKGCIGLAFLRFSWDWMEIKLGFNSKRQVTDFVNGNLCTFVAGLMLGICHVKNDNEKLKP